MRYIILFIVLLVLGLGIAFFYQSDPAWDPYRPLNAENFDHYYDMSYEANQFVNEETAYWQTEYIITFQPAMAASCTECRIELFGEMYDLLHEDEYQIEIIVTSEVEGDTAPDVIVPIITRSEGTVEHLPPE